MVIQPFLRPATAERIRNLQLRGALTTQLLQDPPEITIRRGPAGNKVTIATVKPVRIRISQRLEFTSGASQGATEIVNGGTARFLTPIDIQRDDRFEFDGSICVVRLVEPESNHGTQNVNFEMVEGGNF